MLFSKDGMFIADEDRASLYLKIGDDEFNELKKITNEHFPKGTIKKSFLSGKSYDISQGAMLDRTWMYDGFKRSIESQEKVRNNFKKHKQLICPNCKQIVTHNKSDVICSNCNTSINYKRYKDTMIISSSKLLAYKLLLNGIKRGLI